MSLLPPRRTRIVVEGDSAAPRRYVVGRGTVLALAALALLLAGLVAAVMISYAGLQRRAAAAAGLAGELATARRQADRVAELEAELERMQDLQGRLLYVLGAGGLAPAPGETLTGGGERPDSAGSGRPAGVAGGAAGPDVLERAAAALATPPPDLWPVSGYATREFAPADPARGTPAHEGIDLAAPEGSPVRAAGEGVVALAGWDDGLGNVVEIRHGFGYVTIYGHCSRLAVTRGERVARGQVIGYVGRTGRATAPHLHFEVWKNGEAVDPRSLLPGGPPR